MFAQVQFATQGLLIVMVDIATIAIDPIFITRIHHFIGDQFIVLGAFSWRL